MHSTTLTITNCYSQLITTDQELRRNLWQLLRFRERGYFHSNLFKQKRWDGYVDFFSITSGKFLTGLLPEVELVLKTFGVKYETKDTRQPVEFLVESITKDFLKPWTPEAFLKEKKRSFELYDYQVELVNRMLEYGRATIQAPTSAGKTEMLIAFMKCLPPKTPTLVLANRTSLIHQNYKALLKWGFQNVGRLGDGHAEPDYITCSTIQSLGKIEKLLPHIKVLVVDEVHDLMTGAAKKYYKKMTDCAVRVALSATPFKYGGTHDTQKYSVKGYFGPVMKIESADDDGLLTTKELQDRGNLSKSKCTFFPVTEPELPFEIYQDAVTYGMARNLHFHNIVTNLAKKQKGRTLILVERTEHGDALQDMMPDALWVRGQDNEKTRAYVIDELQKSKKNIVAIATQGIFNTGINVFVHNLINAAGGNAEHVIIQRMGRGLRTAEDKEILNYFDFLFFINDYLLEHSRKRVRILKQQGHEVIVREDLEF